MIVLVVLLGAGLSSLFSGRQPATVALDIGFSFLRLLTPVMIALMAQELISREFDRRFYLISMTYPLSRPYWLIGRVAVLFLGVALFVLVVGLLLSGVVSVVGEGYAQRTPPNLAWAYWLSMSFFLLDCFVVVCFSCFLAVSASTSSFVLIGSLGFVMIARGWSSIVDLLESQGGLVVGQEGYAVGLRGVGYLFPDLGSLDIRGVSLYGSWEFFPGNWHSLIVAHICYGFAFLALGIYFLKVKRLS